MKLFLMLLMTPFFLSAFSHDHFDRFQSVYTQEEIAFRLKYYLQKDPELEHNFLLTPEAFFLYASLEDKNQQRPEYTLKLATAPSAHPPSSLPASFQGLRIALDPGHVGGNLARLEQRWIYMSQTKPAGAPDIISFREGTLALLTAKLLKKWLEAEGAHVLLTKEEDGQAVYEKTFFEWLKEEGKDLSLPPTDLFRSHYNRLDLQARAKKINAFHPHVTLIIHYNAHADRDPLTQENPPQPFNYNLVFVGGGFCKGELDTPSNRHEFLRMLLTDDVQQSIRLSQLVLTQFTQQLKVPPIDEKVDAPYLYKASMKISEGIYARNLALTRLVHGPLCYGESLCQDHKEECIRLNAKDLKVEGIEGPQRVEQVAKAYYEALRAFIYKENKSYNLDQ